MSFFPSNWIYFTYFFTCFKISENLVIGSYSLKQGKLSKLNYMTIVSNIIDATIIILEFESVFTFLIISSIFLRHHCIQALLMYFFSFYLYLPFHREMFCQPFVINTIWLLCIHWRSWNFILFLIRRYCELFIRY